MQIAVRDLPGDEAPGPDMIPNELYQNCPAAHALLANLFNNMTQRVYVPKEARLLYAIPLGRPGKGPAGCANSRPIALLSPLAKLRVLKILISRYREKQNRPGPPPSPPETPHLISRRAGLFFISSINICWLPPPWLHSRYLIKLFQFVDFP